MSYPDLTKPYILYTDASNYCLGAIPGQVQEGREHVIAYASRLMIPREKRYGITEKEALAVIFACEKFCKYLRGRKFTLCTDHTALKSIGR